MTDAAIPITQSAVERFTESYLQSLGCSIERNGVEWEVGIPERTNSDVLTEDVTLLCAREDEIDGEVKHLHPESQFFQELLSEASQRNPVGKVSLTSEDTSVEPPPWLQDSNVSVENIRFTPYYDRSAIVVLFRIEIETVSEYQREFLRTIALDARSQERLQQLENTFLDITSIGRESINSNAISLDRTDISSLLEDAHSRVVDQVQNLIDQTHEEASRAADAELEEYRQMQQQRIKELEERHAKLSAKINELSETINSDEQSDRVEVLKERREVRDEYEKVGEELKELRRRRDQGFPERQEEIRERHALEVRSWPLTITEVEYESGEIELNLADRGATDTITVGYGNRVGVTESVQCSSCNQVFTEENPIWTIQNGLRCEECGANIRK